MNNIWSKRIFPSLSITALHFFTASSVLASVNLNIVGQLRKSTDSGGVEFSTATNQYGTITPHCHMIKGTVNSVITPYECIKSSTILYHTHPNRRPPSYNDLLQVVNNHSISVSYIITGRSSIYKISKPINGELFRQNGYLYNQSVELLRENRPIIFKHLKGRYNEFEIDGIHEALLMRLLFHYMNPWVELQGGGEFSESEIKEANIIFKRITKS